jgi:hypothetical protein
VYFSPEFGPTKALEMLSLWNKWQQFRRRSTQACGNTFKVDSATAIPEMERLGPKKPDYLAFLRTIFAQSTSIPALIFASNAGRPFVASGIRTRKCKSPPP